MAAALGVAGAQPCPSVGPGGTLGTDTGGTGATPTAPVQASVTISLPSPVCLAVAPLTMTPPGGIAFLGGQQVDLAIAQADPNKPPVATFTLDVSAIPPGESVQTLELYKDGTVVAPCTGGASAPGPDPCLTGRDLAPDGDAILTALTTTPGSWAFGAKAASGFCETSADCDDGSVCTADACLEGRCSHDPVPDGTPCPDASVCNGEERCQAGVCVPAAVFPCAPPPSTAWIAAFGAGTLVGQPLATGLPVTSVALDHPWGVAVNPVRGEVYVTQRNADRMAIVDAASGRVTGSVGVGAEPLGVAVDPAGARVYVASYRGGVAMIDPSGPAVVATAPVSGGPTGVAVHPDGERIYVTNYRAGRMTVLAADSPTPLADVAVGRLPLGVAVHPSGTKVYVANHRDGTVSVVGTVSNTVTGSFAVGNKPFAIAFDATGTRAWVSNARDGTVSVVDAVADAVVATVPLDAFLFGLALDPSTNEVCALSAGAGSVSVLDGAGQKVFGLPTARTPVSLGQFVLPASGCPPKAMACDDGDPFTRDTCDATRGCRHDRLDPADAAGQAVQEIDGMLLDPTVAPPATIACIETLLSKLNGELPHLADPRAMARARRMLKAILRCVRRGVRPNVRGRILDLVRATSPEICRH